MKAMKVKITIDTGDGRYVQYEGNKETVPDKFLELAHDLQDEIAGYAANGHLEPSDKYVVQK